MWARLLDWLHVRIVMTYEELRRKFEDFKERFFKAGKLKKQLATLDECLKAMEDPFTFEIVIYPWEKEKAHRFTIEIPERTSCDPVRETMGKLKLIHMKKLHDLGVKE
jgi:hypothetical protein